MIGDASEHVAQISFGIEAVQLGGFNERVGCRGAFTAGIGTGEQIVLPAQRNLAVILPISGRTLWSNIAGIRCTDRGCVVFGAYESVSEARTSIGRYLDFYNPASQHPSVYVVEKNRFC